MAAAIAYQQLPATCRTCRLPGAEEQRAAWGCDAPTAEPLFRHRCVRCHGADPDCALCFGTGEQGVHRCPWAQVHKTSARVVEAVNWLAAGVLPAAGGRSNQSHTFLRAAAVVLEHRDRILAERAPAHHGE